MAPLNPDVRVPGLEPGAVHAWTVPVLPEADAAAALVLLDAEERARAARFRFPADHSRYVTGRSAARVLLAAYAGGVDPRSLRFVPGAHGKPALDDPGAPHFNWAHAGDLVVFAVSHIAEVGVDVERTERFADLDAVAGRVFSDHELAEYVLQRDDARRVAFFNGWTRKEAFIKATGEGMTRGLKTFAVTLAPERTACIERIDDAQDHPARWTLHAFEPRPGYAAAVAVRAPDVALRVMAWPPPAG